ncbi:hypothetical protein I7I51_07120 [Histoplasma capsulatum]|uniref:SGNH hydrolase-type esterase domain-containing protein n=1 Tax=Ajellomyces capsulatus TaxID=5037 RepID=A0A8A1MNR4_AJECA|nr:predicted protein [Histoplasma mississippiense (nom. inval.)]EDN10056.1 predicted protein [Histoplasma mississippiense (nom. inval.)]QSS66263.1 hypothetical protein I7I51_07120 [Histoplasma capsulatum]
MKTLFPSLSAFLLLCAEWASADHPGIPDALVEAAPFSQFKNVAILGDSYAAGIGAGKLLGSKEDKKCSRYDGAYGPVLLSLSKDNKPKSQFIACSGDTSDGIKKQAESLDDKSHDLVTLSAGGNDALLSTILMKCILLPSTAKSCDNALAESETIINNKLQGNIEGLLKVVNKKMKDDGIVLYTLYATFFNSETDKCDNESWNFLGPVTPGGVGSLKLTKDLRRTFNRLVTKANDKISKAIKNANKDKRVKVVPVAWDKYVVESKGRFCEEDPDSKNKAFFQPKNPLPIKAVEDDAENPNPAEKAAASPNPAEKDMEVIQKRVPDGIGKVFHPNELGQGIIATHAILALYQALEPPKVCKVKTPKPTCNMDWASELPFNVFDKTYANFCKRVESMSYFPLEMKVNSDGSNVSPPIVVQDPSNYPWWPLFGFHKRTPPPNPKAFDDVHIIFDWSPRHRPCKMSCKKALSTITASPCGHTGSQMNTMAVYGEIDAGCGVYRYKLDGPEDVVPPPPEKEPDPIKPELSKIHCYKTNEFGKHDDVNPLLQRLLINPACKPAKGKTMREGDDPIVYDTTSKGAPYYYEIKWKHKCKSTVKELDPYHPVPGDKSVVCEKLFYRAYKECDNGGTGGSFDVGCLRYDFAGMPKK